MKKRLLSLICILALCLGLLPVSAFAEPVDNGTAAVNSPQAENVEPPEEPLSGLPVLITLIFPISIQRWGAKMSCFL